VTVTLHLKPEVEASLLEQAQASGMALEDYLLTLVEEAALSMHGDDAPAERESRAEAVRKMLEFGERHRLSVGQPITRGLMHESHRF
jgi:hypothetical protein